MAGLLVSPQSNSRLVRSPLPKPGCFTLSQKQTLREQLALRGQRAKARTQDILPTPADDEIIAKSFVMLIAEMIAAFTLGNSRWKDCKSIATAVAEMMPKDRPLPPNKSDARPFGVFDVNKGSKKGVVQFLVAAQEQSTLAQTVWSSIWRIFVGDWLSSNNLRAARRDRTDDINAMERLDYAQELSAPFHFVLQAGHMIMRTHYGHAVEDPASLAAHKGLLNRKWDVKKPNYAAAKSLIRHSLIARILHCVMVINGFTLYSQLSEWKPTLEEIQAIALTISTNFATATAAVRGTPCPSIQLQPITLPHYLVRSFVQRPSHVRPHPSPSIPLHPVARTGTCCVIKLDQCRSLRTRATG
ncbi:hypothetical protein K438DRAFT_813931 [Mycena galopus ATCC 62051]|nr:hypothetical protein K438DRAFT_813931 [Mycena galopus ATCC 62051]